jgi:hypothetical protein
MKRWKATASPGGSAQIEAGAQPGREAVAEEIARLRAGCELDESLIERMSLEVRALFEVSLIDALSKWPRKDQHCLRSTLIKHGYDEYCSRRIMKEAVPDSVRASTLLHLLRPQSQSNGGQVRQLSTGELKLADAARCVETGLRNDDEIEG